MTHPAYTVIHNENTPSVATLRNEARLAYAAVREESNPSLAELQDELRRMRAEMAQARECRGHFTVLAPDLRVAEQARYARALSIPSSYPLARKQANMRARMARKRGA